MARIIHFGTFDVENYGDLLFPLILEKKIACLGHEIVHVSPIGDTAVWEDCRSPVSFSTFLRNPGEIAGVVLGGGNIVHSWPTQLKSYLNQDVLPWVAYPMLWLLPSYLARKFNVPFVWNGPGIPRKFEGEHKSFIKWATCNCDYLAVRDQSSQERLVEIGVANGIHVIPDTAIELNRLWSEEELYSALRKTFEEMGVQVPEKYIVFHLNQRYVTKDLTLLAFQIETICKKLNASPLFIAIGPCHSDGEIIKKIVPLISIPVYFIEKPKSLVQIAACIRHSIAYFGSSLHGMITACSFKVPGILVASEKQMGFYKFSGFLKQVNLKRSLCSTWQEAAERPAGELVAIQQIDLEAAIEKLDIHWTRVCESLCQVSSEVDNNRECEPIISLVQGLAESLQNKEKLSEACAVIMQNQRGLEDAISEVNIKVRKIEVLEKEVSRKTQLLVETCQALKETKAKNMKLQAELTSGKKSIEEKSLQLHGRDSRLRLLEKQITEVKKTLANNEMIINMKSQDVRRFRDELHSVYTSKSWRYTLPMRKVGMAIWRTQALIHKPHLRAKIKRAYFLLPAFIRNSRWVDNLKNRFKEKETPR